MKNVFSCLGLLCSLACAAFPAEPKPNIIFILADDLGIGNVSCYGADNFKTPNVDTLAKSGLRFEHCYASPLCGPSRALLMTGRYAYHTGMTGNDTGPRLKPANEVMMPRVLKPAGYVTAMCGKWSQLPLQPSDWGFDEYLRFNGSGKYWNTQPAAKNYNLNGQRTPLRDGEYLPDRMHEFVVDFIKRHKDHPFYVYYAMSHVHAQILPTPDTKPDTKDPFKLFQDNVAYMDKLVGKLLAELDRLKLRENTLVLFAGDNGTAVPWYLRSTVHGKALSGHKATMLECGALVPCIASWPAKVPGDRVTQGLINLCDFYPTLAEIAGAKLPAGVTLDGRDFTSQLRGQSEVWPRDWIFVELGRRWYDRDMGWKLNEASELYDLRGAPYAELLVPTTTQDAVATAERVRLQAILDQLNPAGGILAPDNGPGRLGKKAARKAAKAQKGGVNGDNASENANAPDQ
jgi:arylsulfatase A-like enzyme